MKLSSAFSLFIDLRFAIQAALLPTICALWHSPSLIFSPGAISRLFMAHVWRAFGDSCDQNGRPVKEKLIFPNAYGVVLDLGAGHGHTSNYLDHDKVSRYVALEPNTLMHSKIRATANANGFVESDGTLLILSCGAEDIVSVLTSLGPSSVDTIISILTLCSVPAPEQTLGALVRSVLKSGGTLLFYEHVLSPRDDVAWWQRFWTPLWKSAFDGCRLDRPTHLWIERLGVWSDGDLWDKEGEDEENLFWHRIGKFVRE